MNSQTIRGPLFKWFGSKWMASRYYPAPHSDSIIEPFGGAAGYSLRHHSKDVTIAESNKYVYNLWKWIIQYANEEKIMQIPIDLPEGTSIVDLPLSNGQKLMLKHWQRTNNVGNCWTTSPWGNLPGQWTENTRKRVASEVHLVSHWKVCQDGFELLESDLRRDPSVTWFIDPVYLFNYRYGMNGDFDYTRLASAVNKISGQVIVCEAICPKTGRTPDYLPFTFFRKQVTSRRGEGDNTHSKELIFHKLAQ